MIHIVQYIVCTIKHYKSCIILSRSLLMESMNAIVAANIKRIRQERGLSLDDLSRLSGVSKSMLAQIERGEGNPTISTLWKISNGMSIPFDAMTVRPESEYDIVRMDDIQPLPEDSGRVHNRPIFPDDGKRHFAVYFLTLDKGSYWESEPHLKGAEEFITVIDGAIEITADGKAFSLGCTDSIRFKADTKHSYRNIGETQARMHMIIYNP